jgi:hypothetical protein
VVLITPRTAARTVTVIVTVLLEVAGTATDPGTAAIWGKAWMLSAFKQM